jgi:hypothetical protein
MALDEEEIDFSFDPIDSQQIWNVKIGGGFSFMNEQSTSFLGSEDSMSPGMMVSLGSKVPSGLSSLPFRDVFCSTSEGSY